MWVDLSAGGATRIHWEHFGFWVLSNLGSTLGSGVGIARGNTRRHLASAWSPRFAEGYHVVIPAVFCIYIVFITQSVECNTPASFPAPLVFIADVLLYSMACPWNTATCTRHVLQGHGCPTSSTSSPAFGSSRLPTLPARHCWLQRPVEDAGLAAAALGNGLRGLQPWKWLACLNQPMSGSSPMPHQAHPATQR